MPSQEFSFYEYITGLRRRWWLILLITLIVLGGVELFTRVVKPSYQAKTVLLLEQKQQSGGALGALAALTGGGQADPLAILNGEMQSHAVLSRLSRETGIPERKLPSVLNVKPDPAANQLNMDATQPNPERALVIVREALAILTDVDSHADLTTSQEQAIQYKKAVEQKTKELEIDEDALRRFEESSKSVPDPTNPTSSGTFLSRYRELVAQGEQLQQSLNAIKAKSEQSTKTSIELPTGLPVLQGFHDQILSLDLQRDLYRTQYGDSSPQVVALDRQIAATKRDLQAEVQKYLKAINNNLGPDLAQLETQSIILKWQTEKAKTLAEAAPKEGQKAGDLFREATILGGVVVNLRQQYEQSLVQAQVDQVKWAVLDEPYVVGVINKNYILNGLLSGFAGLLIGLLVATAQISTQKSKSAAEARRLEASQEV